MTRTIIFTATAAVWSIILVAAGATFYGARPDAVRPEIEDDSGEPLKKGDRLPWSAPGPLATTTQLTPPVASLLPEQLPLATEDDIWQADADITVIAIFARAVEPTSPSSIISIGVASCSDEQATHQS
jgi:hypothetical protein